MEFFGTPSQQLLWVIILPLIAAMQSKVVRHANSREAINLSIAAILCALIFSIVRDFWQGKVVYELTLVSITSELSLAFNIEPLGALFMCVIGSLWLVTTLYAIGYLRGNVIGRQGSFYCFFALSIASTLIIAMAGNLLTLFVGYEILTLATFPLIGHTGTKEARNSGRVYLGILMGTSVCFLLPAIVMTYHAAGTLDFVSGGVLPEELTPAFIAILLALFVFGIGKAAVMPFHRWLPAAMVAPTPVSALLHAVAVVKAGVFSIVKVMVYIFGYERLVFQHDFVGWSVEWLTYIACFTIISASVVALYQDSLKKRLAYSTIGQLSYVVLAASTFSPIAMVAAIFHIVAHAFSKITLFFAAGAIYTASGKKYISQLDGIARQMPWTMTAFAVGALSMIAVPPTVGFVSKWYMFVGAFSNANYLVIATLVISTILNAMYFLPIVFRAFFKKPSGKVASCGEAPLPSVIALVVTAFMTLFLFVYPDMVISFAANVLGVRE